MENQRNDAQCTLAEATERTNGKLIFTPELIGAVANRKGFESVINPTEFLSFMHHLGIKTIQFALTDEKSEIGIQNFNNNGEAYATTTLVSSKQKWSKSNNTEPLFMSSWTYDLVVKISKVDLEKSINYREISPDNQHILLESLLINLNKETREQILLSALSFNIGQIPFNLNKGFDNTFFIFNRVIASLNLISILTNRANIDTFIQLATMVVIEFVVNIENAQHGESEFDNIRINPLIPYFWPICSTAIGLVKLHRAELFTYREIQQQTVNIENPEDLEA